MAEKVTSNLALIDFLYLGYLAFIIGNFRHEFASQGCVFAIPGCIFCTFGMCIWYFGCAHFGREITSNFALIDFPLYDNWPFWEEPRFVTGRPTFLEMDQKSEKVTS